MSWNFTGGGPGWTFVPDFTSPSDNDDLGVWSGDAVLLPALTTTVADHIPLANFVAIKYLLSVSTLSEGSIRYCELSVIKIGDGIHVLSDRLQNTGLNLTVNTEQSGPYLDLKIANNENFDLRCRFIKTLL